MRLTAALGHTEQTENICLHSAVRKMSLTLRRSQLEQQLAALMRRTIPSEGVNIKALTWTHVFVPAVRLWVRLPQSTQE